MIQYKMIKLNSIPVFELYKKLIWDLFKFVDPETEPDYGAFDVIVVIEGRYHKLSFLDGTFFTESVFNDKQELAITNVNDYYTSTISNYIAYRPSGWNQHKVCEKLYYSVSTLTQMFFNDLNKIVNKKQGKIVEVGQNLNLRDYGSVVLNYCGDIVKVYQR